VAAALVNATQSHAFELDDYHPAAKLHAGTVVVPSALAVLSDEHGLDELTTALVAAYDVMIRLGLAMDPSATRGRGWHLTGLTGPFGAAAVVGRLRGLDRGALVRAFGIAGSCSSGLFAFSRAGSMTKQLHAGRAAEAGVTAVDLALGGLTSPTDVLEADDGGLLRAVSDESVPERLLSDLGVRFEISNVSVKPYPCCGSVHSAIDCALAIRKENPFGLDEIKRVIVHTAALVDRQCGFPYSGRGGALEAQMSMRYCVAVALADGEVSLRQFSEDRRTDSALLALAGRVGLELDPEIDRAYPARFAGRVSVELRSGETYEHAVAEPLGSPDRCDRTMVEDKFLDLTADLLTPDSRQTLVSLLDRSVGPGGLGATMDKALGRAAIPS
jgi:2-methylcitrate dehydratase PrpD